MPGNRKAAEKFILDNIEAILPGSPNKGYWEDYMKALSDKDFDTFINNVGTGKENLSVICPNSSKIRLDLNRNFALAEKLGFDFYERVWIKNSKTGKTNLTPHRFMVLDLPVRRQAQLLTKKISIPKHNRSIDYLTGQPTGKDSKGSKISYPEAQILAAARLDRTVIELMKYRGGDLKGFNAMNLSISRTGGVSQDALDKLGTKVKSTQTLRTILLSMHLKSTL